MCFPRVEAIENMQERERRSRLARDHVFEQFTWSAISAELVEVLEQTAGGVPAG